MTNKQIISDLGLDQSYWLAKKYAGKLSGLLSLINDLEKLPGYKVSLTGVKGNYEMVRDMPKLSQLDYRRKEQFFEAEKQQQNCKMIYGEFEQWQTVEISHNTGCYKFPFPMNNRLYNVIASMAGEVMMEDKKEVQVLNSILIDSKFLKVLPKAIKFIAKDELRPAMQHICLSFDKGICEVVATDAHRLYLSPKFECSQLEDTKMLISAESAKKLSKIKPEGDTIEIGILTTGEIMVMGCIYPIFDARFPDYKVVIPEYDKSMEFETKAFINNVNKVLPSSNKRTSQVTFHLNGSIALHSEDIDMGLECDANMMYVSKDFPDTDIAFNGKMLVDSLGIFKDKTIKMKSHGHSHHAGIFTNDSDTVLVMPLLLNTR